MISDPIQPIAVPPEAGRVLQQIGVTHLLTSRLNGGGYYLFEAEFGPESGNRLHVHTYEDEVVYVLSGTLQVRLGAGQLEASTGAAAHLPKGIPHALYNPLKTPLKLLALAVPGGMEKFFDELETAIQDGSLDDAKHRAISRKYGIEWLE
ncbi:MAG: cupin domain-containing protein [Anaerolineales bacterium]